MKTLARFLSNLPISVYLLTIVGIRFLWPTLIQAAPTFTITGSANPVENSDTTWKVFLNTDGSTITAMQTVVSFSSSFFTSVSIPSYLGSNCSFPAPADPSLGYGSASTPYFYGGTKVVLACGFTGGGLTSSGNGDFIASFTLTPTASGSTSFSFSNTLLRYIGTTITPGTSADFDLVVYESSEAASQASPTATPGLPSPTPTTAASASANTSDSSSGSTAVEQTVMTDDDLNFVELEFNKKSSTTTESQTADLQIIDEDDVIPPVPANLPTRPAATPPSLNQAQGNADANESEKSSGEVLSVSSLRELLIPGQSPADRSVVLFNLISTLTFIVLLAIALWRLITTSRMNKLKYEHMTDILSSELSMIETKMSGLDKKEDSDETKKELTKSFEDLVDQMKEGSGKKK